MKQHFAILVIILLWIPLMAQVDSLSQEIETIIIKDRRLEIGLSEVSRNIHVIDKESIESMPVQSLSEALQYIAGVDVRRRGINGVQADVSIRGGTFDQTLVLVNGINMSDPQTGHHLMNIPVDLENIERIEVLKGPAARVYGQNAFAGAINIITKSVNQRSINFSTSYSQNVTGRGGIQVSLPGKRVNHQIAYSKSFSEGYRYNTDFQIDNFFYQSDIKIGADKLMIQAGYTDRAFGANGFYASPAFVEQYEELGTSLLSARYTTQKNNWRISPTIYWRRNQDEYIFVRSNPSIYRNLHIGNTYGAELNTSQINTLGALGLGMELRHDDLRSNNLGDRNRTTFGLNAEQRMVLLDNNLDITPGMALFSYSDFGTRLFPGIDLGYALSSSFRIFANAGSTWRIPTYTDLFYEDSANLGNPDLEPETAFTIEMGLHYQQKNMRLRASAFQRKSDDLIDWTKSSVNDPWYPSNVGEVTVRGIELGTNYELSSLSSFGKTQLNLQYTYLQAENKVDAIFSRYALELITHHFTSSLQYMLSKKVYHSVFVKYADRFTLDSYTLLDTKLGYRTPKFDLNFFINNLLDRKYTETNLVPMPGRWVGINFNFKG